MDSTEIKTPPGKQEIIVTRTYNAPRELVYKIVTDPKLIPEWWGPRNLTTIVEKWSLGGVVNGDLCNAILKGISLHFMVFIMRSNLAHPSGMYRYRSLIIT